MPFSIIIFLVIILTLVLIHEFGHYMVGRLAGVVATRFWIGFGPTIFSFKRWGTEFCIKCVPLGGACVFEEHEEERGIDKNGEPIVVHVDDLSYLDVKKRLAVVLAGPLSNFILAFILCIILTAFSECDRPVIQEIIDGFPAQEAGLLPGDSLVAINGERIYLGREFELWLALNPGKPLNLAYERDGTRFNTVLVPKEDEETGRLLYGFRGYKEYFRPGIADIIPYAFYELRFCVLNTYKSLVMIITGQVSRREVSGVVGMAVMVDEVTKSTLPYGIWMTVLNLISFASMISVNLGFLNLVPIPALDGGRIIFMLVELIRGKPIPPEKEGLVHMAGFIVLMSLGVLVIVNDIARLMGK